MNTDPLSTEQLRGRPIVVLFWSSTCEGSWVRLRQLERLESRHGDRLEVVAVHSPRFDFERDLATLSDALESRAVSIPVLHDPRLDTWSRYGPIGRPTVVVIDHRLRVVGAMSGTDERSVEALDQIIDEQVAIARSADPSAVRRRPTRAPTDETAGDPLHRLRSPASMARLLDGTVAVADRGSGRLLAVEIDHAKPVGRVTAAFGGLHGIGHIASRSGGQLAASFPDRGEVESIDLASKERTTVAKGLLRPAGMIEDRDGSLVVADAGADQLIRVTDNGTGAITRGDLSQPLAVTRIDAGLLIVEAATGALRLLTDKGKLRTINDGAQAGLLDGPAHRALFQRPTGVATLDDGSIAIADCGNHRIRIMKDRMVTTLPVTGLCRPEALLFIGNDRLLCCDTGNDRLVLVGLTDRSVAEVSLDGLPV